MHRVVCARLQLDLSQASDPLLAYLASTWCVNTAGSYSGIADYLNDVCHASLYSRHLHAVIHFSRLLHIVLNS